jgi:hypothetical protein
MRAGLVIILAIGTICVTKFAKTDDITMAMPQVGCESALDSFVTGQSGNERETAVNSDILKNYRGLLTTETLTAVLTGAAKAGFRQCPANNVVVVNITMEKQVAVIAWTSRLDGQWRIVRNSLPAITKQEDDKMAQAVSQQR